MRECKKASLLQILFKVFYWFVKVSMHFKKMHFFKLKFRCLLVFFFMIAAISYIKY